jgi:iron complex outermembrane receptor protein
LEFGSEAPLTAENAGELLPPRKTRQDEVGWKGEWRDLAISTAAFRMQRPYEFTDVTGNSFAGMGKFHQAGTQTHTGWEFAGEGRPTARLQIFASAAWIDARAKDTGEPAIEGVQIQNIPKVRSTLFARYALADAPGWELSAGWLHSGKRNARRDGSVSVSGYDRFDAGLSWTTVWSGYRTKMMLNVTNLTDRRYWRDVSEAYSADLLFPGAPREIVFGVLIEGT